MGKKSREKKKNRSSITQHQKIGKKLIPPMLRSPIGDRLLLQSWINSRLAEMLWACLVISVFPKQHALAAFRKIAAVGFKYRDTQQEWKKWDLTHSLLIALPNDVFHKIVEIIISYPLGYAALRPLLLLESLPGRKRWEFILKIEPQMEDWKTLMQAVASTLDHQSEEATAVRWLTVMFKIALGRISFLYNMKEKMECIVDYPNRGDLRSVRPSIRAMEMNFRLVDGDNWSNNFWQECLEKTNCIPGKLAESSVLKYDINNVFEILCEAQLDLLKHFDETLSTTDIDARHDAIFGFGFYSLALLMELFTCENKQFLTGRLIIRTLVECRISLAYLLTKDEIELWSKFRSFGAGQAKLVLLKLDEFEDKPSFLTESLLEQLASEDTYQEFLPIDLGHWCGLDLRKMAEVSGTKDDYDKYYGWGSIYVHGHWPAIRSTCFVICHNPLHRLHRMPSSHPRLLEDTVPDGIYLVNSILSDVARAYPGLQANVAISEITPEEKFESTQS